MVTHGHSTEGHPGHRTDKTAGQKRSDLRLWWWPGAGSSRRPSDFQAERARPGRSPRAEFVLSREELGPSPSGGSGARVSKSVSKPEPRRVAAARMLGAPLGCPYGAPVPVEAAGRAYGIQARPAWTRRPPATATNRGGFGLRNGPMRDCPRHGRCSRNRRSGRAERATTTARDALRSDDRDDRWGFGPDDWA